MLSLATLLAWVAWDGTGDARAAVRVCQNAFDVEVAGRTEQEGRRKALAAWREDVAQAHGQAFTSWGVANERQLACRPLEGQFVCRARARPCRLQQVAPKRPARPTSGLDV